MTDDEQAQLFQEARSYGLRLDAALERVAQECQCALINSAALLKTAPAAATPDLSARVAALMQAAAPTPAAK